MAKTILIVGAGVCGLSAALMLLDKAEEEKKEKPNITILEAAPYIGGRMRGTVFPNRVPVDLGAGWFQGGKDNQFYQWLKSRYHLHGAVEDDQPHKEFVSPPETSADFIEGGLKELEDEFAFFQVQQPGDDLSLEALCERINSADADKTASFMSVLWMGMDEPRQVSSAEMLGDPFGPGGMILKDGMQTAVIQMAEELQARGVVIETARPVTQIRTLADKPRITCAEGSVYTGDAVLVTVSAGVLKSRSILFESHVQEKVRHELQGINMGRVTKIILALKPEFFAQKNIKDNSHLYLADHEPPLFIHLKTGGRPTIIVFTGGQDAEKIERTNDEAIKDFIASAFANFPELQEYEDYLEYPPCVTAWNSNPYTLGAYTSASPGKSRCNPFIISHIAFAGEAFVADPNESPTTLLGAFHSARRALPLL